MVNVAIEGESDAGAVRAILNYLGKEVGTVSIARGKTRLDPKIAKYNDAAKRIPWVVFRDSDSVCPVRLQRELTNGIRARNPKFMLRIAHSMTEAWLLADRGGFADYFHVSRDIVPVDPEALPHAKRTVLQICARSRSRTIRSAMVTKKGATGPLYVSTINDFAAKGWDVGVARLSSASLDRALRRIADL